MLWKSCDYVEFILGNSPEKNMLVELFGPLIGLPEEWQAQGAAKEQIDLSWFGFDYINTYNIKGLGVINPLKTQILEETDEYIIERDYLGRTSKMIKATATIPLPMDFPVETMDDWLKIKHMFAYSDQRLHMNDIDEIKKQKADGAMIVASIPGGFDIVRELMGEENTCLAYYDQPELIFDILNTISEANFKVLDYITNHVAIDQLSTHEDMAGKSGPLVGPNIVSEFIKPYYRKSWDLVSARGTKLFCQDSDGNMESVMDAFIDSGINVFYPCEPAAGMDIVKLRKKYGKAIAYKGGIDKHVLRENKEAIKKELEYKMQPSMRGAGIIFGLDHRIPNGTPLENYIYYVQTARELLGLPAIENSEKGWGRAAF